MSATTHELDPIFRAPRYADAVSLDGGETTVVMPPELKVGQSDGKLALLVRFEISLEELTAILFASTCAEDIATDQQVLEEAVLACAIPADYRIWECVEETAREAANDFGSWGTSKVDRDTARGYLPYCQKRAAEVISGHVDAVAA